ncbi:DUF6415 family natural product biosynthesis protein [Streptomyces sp. bgisy130]|uniref:DUF6415 family natural product biosynthesis protein n=1 Tax=Streptomyces sp. bgisy130 TaxID=3413788 RepID=UPI003F49F350
MNTESEQVRSGEAVVGVTGQQPIDVATIRASIARAQTLRRESPELDELVELEALLRGHIEVLLPEVQAAYDRLWRGSVGWSRGAGRLSGVRFQVRQGLGEGVVSAHVQVNQLARDCQWLLDEREARQQ